ncbi:MAG: hypothetical protein HXM15_05410 [Fusobacterium periodonticum]|nr:hypothetical protein [Fusobacterium periodonticum]
MEKVNYQTQAKIDNIKKDIKDNVSLKDIKKKYFTQSKNKLDKWLSVNSKNFTGEELNYLEYVITGEEVEVTEEITKVEENKIVEAFNYLPTTENIALMSIADRQKFLISNAVIEKLVNLLSSSNTEEIEINDEVRGLKDIKGQNIRISESIYKEFTDICRRNNVTITSVINTIFYNFNQKHK